MTTNRNFNLHNGETGSAITIRLTTKAARNEIAQILNDGTIKIHLTASGSDEEINKALIKFLTEILKTDAERIEIIAGQSGRDKLVTILDMDVASVNKKIIHALA